MIYSQEKKLTLYIFLTYDLAMKTKTESVLIRVSGEEKEAFGLSASLAGISLSSWIRERLRLAAIRELEAAGKRVPFVPEVRIPEL